MRRCACSILGLLAACFSEDTTKGTASDDSTTSATTAPMTTTPTPTTTVSDSTTTTDASMSSGDLTSTGSSSTEVDASSTEGVDTDTSCRHRLFLSAAEPQGAEVGSFANASLLCQNEADDERLGGSWVAVLSDEDPAAVNVTICGDVYLANDGEGAIDDTLVAYGDKWWMDDHEHAIDRHANGALLDPGTSSSAAWTGSNVGGTSNPLDCGGWGEPLESGQWGWAAPLGRGSWISDGALACDQPLHLFCIEQFG